MESLEKIFEQKIRRLKEARLRLLRLHKLLVDKERASFERENGQVSSSMFLNLLLNDKNFAWLKNFSTLIVEIDEMLDLDDGYSDNMIEKHFSRLENLFNFRIEDEVFVKNYRAFLQTDSEVAAMHSELKNILAEK